MKFSDGAGSAEVIVERAKRSIDPAQFEAERTVAPGLTLRSAEELYYYRIWREVMGSSLSPHLVGRTLDRSAGV